jgi:hypothetical protein
MTRFIACFSLTLLGVAGCAQGDPIGPSGAGGASSSGPGAGGDGAGGDPSSTSSTSSTTSTSTGPSCSESPCKLTVPQCGCDVDEQCTIGENLARTCAPEGSVGPGQACDADTSCGTGSLCVGFGSGPLTCHAFCEVDGDCTGVGSRCVLTLGDGMGGEVDGVAMCSTPCNLINNAGCNIAGTACRLNLITGDDVPFTNCDLAGSTVYPDNCSTQDDCAVGHVCWPSSSGGNRCFQWCNVDAPTCPGQTTCQAVDVVEGTPLVLGGISYGLCSG